MMTEDKNEFYLKHIVEAINRAGEFTKGMTSQQFEGDYKTQAAVVRQFEIIGEAATKVSADFKDAYAEIDWSKAIGMRNVLIHHYFDIDLDILWATIQEDLSLLRDQIEKILVAK